MDELNGRAKEESEMFSMGAVVNPVSSGTTRKQAAK
jgi:hypothetical protein